MDYQEKIKELEEEILRLNNELQKTKEHLKKYTAPESRKKYYEQNKEKIKERVNEYKKNTNYIYEATPDQKKEYARRAYLKKKNKLKNEENINI
jgi:hypothetical protein